VRAKMSFSTNALNDWRNLIVNDLINLVVGGETRTNPFPYQCNESGVDFVCDMIAFLVMLVRYKSYQFGAGDHMSEMAQRIIERRRPRCLQVVDGANIDVEEEGGRCIKGIFRE
jgi:hypothetical protein